MSRQAPKVKAFIYQDYCCTCHDRLVGSWTDRRASMNKEETEAAVEILVMVVNLLRVIRNVGIVIAATVAFIAGILAAGT